MSSYTSQCRHKWDRNGKCSRCGKHNRGGSSAPSGSRVSKQHSTTGSTQRSMSGRNTHASGSQQPVAQTSGDDNSYKDKALFKNINEDLNRIYNPYWIIPAAGDSSQNTIMPTAQASGSFTGLHASAVQANYQSAQSASWSASSHVYQSAAKKTAGPSSMNYFAPAQQQQQQQASANLQGFHLQDRPDIGNSIAHGNLQEDHDVRAVFDSYESLPSPPRVDISGLGQETSPSPPAVYIREPAQAPPLEPGEEMCEVSCIRCRAEEVNQGLTYRLCKRRKGAKDRRCTFCIEDSKKSNWTTCQNPDGSIIWEPR